MSKPRKVVMGDSTYTLSRVVPRPRAAEERRDWLTEDGAHSLAARIRSTWEALGRHAEVEIVRYGAEGASPFWGVHLTNAPGGVPLKRITQ